ncbi:flagellar protein FlgN [Massilia sp. R2A-15]|uniref:flagella synthesis protein FlgN n=1 Tax=Massilia sp. R2A-15 TaxID=3064278 RepID=UPI0027370E2D|nr:flagellar protein FlgN [Massilia sp. R2A-15]WLI88008.1 flagellar protein FlgN [Massilia sp. R2A-15]
MTSPATTLRDEQQLIASLIDTMQQEQAFLIRADSEGLSGLTPHKAELVQQMAALAARRHQALAAAGFPPSESGMESWLAAHGDDAARSARRELLARTTDAKELNRVNGMLINKQMNHTQTAINAMRTPAGAADSGVYGPSGQAAASGPSRRFVVG